MTAPGSGFLSSGTAAPKPQPFAVLKTIPLPLALSRLIRVERNRDRERNIDRLALNLWRRDEGCLWHGSIGGRRNGRCTGCLEANIPHRSAALGFRIEAVTEGEQGCIAACGRQSLEIEGELVHAAGPGEGELPGEGFISEQHVRHTLTFGAGQPGCYKRV